VRLFFYYFSAGAILSAAFTVGLRNPIYGTLALLSAVLHIAGLFVLLHAEFVFAIQIIIYAGAVLVLYLFVLMLLNVKQQESIVQRQAWISVFFAMLILVEILLVFSGPQNPSALQQPLSQTHALFEFTENTVAIGKALFTDYLLPFEIVGVILLGGAVGALILAKPLSNAQKSET